MAMKEGCAIIEPPGLVALIVHPKYFDMAVVVLNWLAGELNSRLAEKHGVEIRPIVMDYHGAHPSLGLFGSPVDLVDLEKQIHELTEQLLKEIPIGVLIAFVVDSNVDWRTRTDELLRRLDEMNGLER